MVIGFLRRIISVRRKFQSMAKQDMIELDGIVFDTLPNAAFKVKLEN